MGNPIPCIRAFVNGNFTCTPFSCILNCPVIIFTAIRHFTSTITTMQDINQRQHTTVSSYYCDILVFQRLNVFVCSLLSGVLYLIPHIFIYNGNLSIRFLCKYPVLTVQSVISAIYSFSPLIRSISCIDRICKNTNNRTTFPDISGCSVLINLMFIQNLTDLSCSKFFM